MANAAPLNKQGTEAMHLQLLYFARLRDVFGLSSETLAFSGLTVADLVAHLHSRGGHWASELGHGKPFRIAVNHNVVPQTTPLKEGDEVAIFPPVTGG